MRRDEFTRFLLGHFREYESRYGQSPRTCYCPADIFDKFLDDTRDEMLEGTFTDAKMAFFFAGRPCTFSVYGVQVERAKHIQHIDFNIPIREDVYSTVH